MTGPVEQLLVDARCIITDPEDWCQGTYGDLRHGPNCASGALQNAALLTHAAPQTDGVAWELLADIAESDGFCSIVRLNDRTDHPTVLAMFDAAIDVAAEEGL